jgi:aspartate/methionine/tyrosine aminotransferase
LISDEVYDRLIFDNNRKISFAQYSNLKDRLIIVNGYSKSYAMTGWRLGYVRAPTHITNKIQNITDEYELKNNNYSSIFIIKSIELLKEKFYEKFPKSEIIKI